MNFQVIIWLAIALETILFAGILPILPDIGSTAGLGVEYLGVLVGVYAFSSLFTCLPFGLLSDRRNPRLIFLSSLAYLIFAGLMVLLWARQREQIDKSPEFNPD